jgi:putative redox protein
MKATVQWKQNMTFVGMPESGFPVSMDAEPSFGGSGQGVRPVELLALGLAGCTAMDVLSILQKKRQQLTSFEVQVDAERSADHPKVFTRAQITYLVSGRDIEEAAVLRAIELSATKYCPAQAMFVQVFPIDLHYEIYEEEGQGMRRLIFQGSWQEAAPE